MQTKEKRVFKTRKELRLESIKKAKEKYKLAKRHSSTEYNRLRAYSFDVLTNVVKTTFKCGSLRIGILK